MKMFLGLAALVAASTSAPARAQYSTLKKPCVAQDYQFIQNALRNGKVVTGSEKKVALLSLLQQEAAPGCNAIVRLSPPAGIPGNKYLQYELTAGGSTVELSIVVGGVEQPGTRVSIR